MSFFICRELLKHTVNLIKAAYNTLQSFSRVNYALRVIISHDERSLARDRPVKKAKVEIHGACFK